MPDHVTGERLASLFRPRSVALVGASDKSAFSQIAYHNLVQFGLREHTYLVSRRGTPTHGQPTVTSCTQIGEPVDVAYLMVPRAGLLEALDDAAAAGIRNACVLSSGYAEAGEAGRAAQAELAQYAAGLGMVLLGPNHLGFANLTDGVPVCSVPGLPRVPGPVALLSQSGASSSAMVDFAAMANVGLSYLVTLGNEAMITAGHVLDFLVDDPGTRAVAVFMETVRDPETFRRAARRAAAADKAIVVLKAGSSARRPPAGPVARPGRPGRRPRRGTRRPRRPDRGDRPDRGPRPGLGRFPRIARGQPAAGGRRPDRGARRRPHLEGAQLMRTAFTDLVGVPHPIVGFNRSPGVVAAVTNAGGFGVLGASAYTPAELDAQLTWIDEQTRGKPYGVDLLVPEKFATGDPGDLVASLRAQIPDEHLAFVRDLLDRYGVPEVAGNPEHDEIAASLNPDGAAPLLDVAFRHPIRLIANALGPPPAGLVDRARQQGVPVAALVGQPKHAVRQIEAGVDLLIAQGTEAGGHTGTIATMVLTPEIVDIAAGRPVLAAGGIASGRQMAAALALGAAGVWCGSVWLSSEEDVANQAIKAKFLRATSSDTLRSPTRTGKPARQLRSAWHEEWERPGSPVPLPLPLQPMLVNEAWQRIDAAARTGHEGALRLESFFVGQVVGSFEQIRPAGEITRQIVADCEQQIRNLAKLTGDS
jgi:NAD(P)H-dependent flavin oxidoreductase YrpB (nitropropane dioxygenase family)/succinyl-CoA synthetase alpha subunit